MRQFVLTFLFLAATSSVHADDSYARKHPARKVTLAPVIDGDLSDDAWKDAPIATGFWNRLSGGQAPDQTLARVIQDGEALYVAFECLDSAPSKIMARETVRDQKYTGNSDDPDKEDNVTFMVEPFFTRKREDQSYFSVNAIGTRSAAIAGGRSGKAEWQGDWTAVAKRTSTGWTCEIRIPFGMLNYPNADKPVTMGMNFHRYQHHTQTESVWSDIGPQGLPDRAGTLEGVEVPRASFKPSTSALVYVLPGVRDGEATFRSGVDVRTTITPTLTGVASLNPDFGTIEGAVEGISFSRRERFIPDRRPFFVEGGDAFFAGTQMNDIGAFFYSKRIPSFDVGAKVYGKLNARESIGMISTFTLQDRYDGVLRYRRELNDHDHVGVMLSNQSDRETQSSMAITDTRFRRGNWGFEAQGGRTWGNDRDGGFGLVSTTFEDGFLSGVAQYHSISDQFNPANGFIPLRGYNGGLGVLLANRAWKGGDYRSFQGGIGIVDFDRQDGTALWRGYQAVLDVLTRGDLNLESKFEYFEYDGSIDSTWRFGVTHGASNRFRQFGLSVSTGRSAGKPSTFLSPSASLRIGKRFDLAYSGAFLNLSGTTRQQIVSANYEISPIESVGGRLVAQDEDLNWYLSYRRAGAKGMDTYLIIGDPNARRFQRVAQVKLVIPF